MLNPVERGQINFEFKQEIGQEGRNSRTFIAHDHQLDAEIVIKKVPKRNIQNTGGFFSEARALYSSAHPNVVQVMYCCFDDDYIYIAMPYYPKGSVKSLMLNRNLTVREVLRFACQAASGLHNVHSKGLIHFDLKPDNLLLSNRQEALISDFGLAKPANHDGAARPDQMYSKMIPPEVLYQNEFNSKFDIFQLGLTVYRMCCGDDEFERQLSAFREPDGTLRGAFADAVRRGDFPDRGTYPHHVPQKLRNEIRKALDPDPRQRHESVIRFANELASIDGKHLDWQYSRDGDAMVWTKSDEGRMLMLRVSGDRSSEFTRKVGDAAPRRIREGCLPNIQDRVIKRILGSH